MMDIKYTVQEQINLRQAPYISSCSLFHYEEEAGNVYEVGSKFPIVHLSQEERIGVGDASR